MIYVDNNATTPLHPKVIEALQQALSLFGNPSSIHSVGQEAKVLLIQARRTIASYLGVRPQEIFFTSGGTEALNALLFGLTRDKTGHLLSSELEHSAVIKTVDSIVGWKKTLLSPGTRGAVTVEAVENGLRDNVSLIALMGVNNETGVKTPWREIANLAESHHVPFLIDGVSLLGKEAISPLPRGVTGMAFSGHKIHAPKGIGFFYLRSDSPFTPLIIGGGQEGQKRGGTENLLGILGLKRAVELLQEEPPFEALAELRNHFERRLLDEIPQVLINGEGERAPNVSNLSFEGVDGESLLFNLDLKGIQASHGSACSSGSLEPSRILLAMGYPLQRVRSAIRFSFSRLNTKEEIDRVIDLLKVEVPLLRRRG
jgi:cysteine desulfurase